MDELKEVSIIMPVYNERDTIEKVAEKVLALGPKEIIIVDDGSSDGTREVLHKLQIANYKLQIIFHEKNQGKGAAIRTALKYVEGGIAAIQDADLEYEPAELIKLVRPISEKKADVVYGSRFLNPSGKNIYIRYKLGNWFLSKAISVLCGYKITDSYTCYKIFRTEIIKSIDLQSKRFEFEAEVTVKLLRKGVKILELPISYNPRRLDEGKKIGWVDGLVGLWTIWRCL